MLETLVTAAILSIVMTVTHKVMLFWMMGELDHPKAKESEFNS